MKNYIRLALWILCIGLIACAGCSETETIQAESSSTVKSLEMIQEENETEAQTGSQEQAGSQEQSVVKLIDAEPSAAESSSVGFYAEDIDVLLPEASGEEVYAENGITIDSSNKSDGYICIKSEGNESRLKARIILGEATYTYDLRLDGEYEVYPLQMGDGHYEIKIMENVKDSTYRLLYHIELDVELKDATRAFVFPNQYVWYTNEENAILKSFELCAGLESDAEKVQVLYDYVVEHLEYDEEKAEQVKLGTITSYIPDVDETLESGKGICFDYAALLGAMLRAQEIPTRLAIGILTPENILHAWNQVLIDEEWVWYDATLDGFYVESDYEKEKEY